MTNANVNFFGAKEGTETTLANQRELFLKMFGGEILGFYNDYNVFGPTVMRKEIATGKSWQYPVVGIATGQYHTPGTEILGNDIQQSERLITIDGKFISSVFVAEEDEILAHFDLRSEYAKQMAEALAKQEDQKIAQMLAKAARATGLVGHANGTSQTYANTVETDASVLVGAMWNVAQKFDENFLPAMERYLALRPAQYYLLIQGAKDFLDRDLSSNPGDYNKGQLKTAAGLTIVKSTHIPSTNVASNDAREANDYTANYSLTVALAYQKTAVGSLSRMGVSLESEWDIRRQGTLWVAKRMVGHGILRPEAAYEIKKTS